MGRFYFPDMPEVTYVIFGRYICRYSPRVQEFGCFVQGCGGLQLSDKWVLKVPTRRHFQDQSSDISPRSCFSTQAVLEG